MKIVDSLYTYGIQDDKLKTVARKIKYNKKVNLDNLDLFKLYVVVLPVFNDGFLEIYDYKQFMQPFYKDIRKNVTVVGIAGDKYGATELLTQMVQDMLDSGNGLNVKEYFGI